jgi:hypothetical protein
MTDVGRFEGDRLEYVEKIGSRMCKNEKYIVVKTATRCLEDEVRILAF